MERAAKDLNIIVKFELLNSNTTESKMLIFDCVHKFESLYSKTKTNLHSRKKIVHSSPRASDNAHTVFMKIIEWILMIIENNFLKLPYISKALASK